MPKQSKPRYVEGWFSVLAPHQSSMVYFIRQSIKNQGHLRGSKEYSFVYGNLTWCQKHPCLSAPVEGRFPTGVTPVKMEKLTGVIPSDAIIFSIR